MRGVGNKATVKVKYKKKATPVVTTPIKHQHHLTQEHNHKLFCKPLIKTAPSPNCSCSWIIIPETMGQVPERSPTVISFSLEIIVSNFVEKNKNKPNNWSVLNPPLDTYLPIQL